MAFFPTDQRLGIPAIGTTSTTKGVELGTIIRAVDATLGAAEFIYLLGVASTVVGSLVVYNATTFQTALSPTTGNTANPCAVAMSANLALGYDWYQIEGLAVIKKTAVAVTPQVSLFLSATTGRVKVLASAGLQILGARSANLTTVASTVSTVTALINRPFLQGQIT